MRVLVVEPWMAGSHLRWAEGYQRASGHRVDLIGLPGLAWRWRLRGGAVPLARQLAAWVDANGLPDLVLVTGLVDVAHLLGLSRRVLPPEVPVVVYQHESQLVHPRPASRDEQEAALRNWLSWCAADLVLFNSRSHLDAVMSALPAFLSRLPDRSHLPFLGEVVGRFEVLPLGLDLHWTLPAQAGPEEATRLGDASRWGDGGAPVILWPHRWEVDKDPGAFLAALVKAERAGLDFRLVLGGEHPEAGSTGAEAARAAVVERFGHRVVAAGPFPTDHYRQLVARSDLVVSCARHEFFGAAVAEALAAGCVPVLPAHLAYPEVVPEPWHRMALYPPGRFGSALSRALAELGSRRAAASGLAGAVRRFHWDEVAPRYDRRLEQVLSR